jgi:riboflavin kinase/FMN adenylyltransferase
VQILKLLHQLAELASGPRPVHLAIGVFDGVHLGHQAVIRQAVHTARASEGLAVVVTFDRHPNCVVAPDRVPLAISTLAQKLRALEALSVDASLVLPFDEPFSRQTADEFVRRLADALGRLQSISVGRNFTFGYRRGGNLALLETLGQVHGFTARGLDAVSADGQPISSTRIREAIRLGDLDTASQMLGRPYALAGRVVRGRQLGRELGFPTANLDPRGLALPPPGVYAAWAWVDQAVRGSVLNIGRRPTVDPGGSDLSVEAHLLEFTGDLYGQEVELQFVARLRDEAQFSSARVLQEQITRDIAAARRLGVSPHY